VTTEPSAALAARRRKNRRRLVEAQHRRLEEKCDDAVGLEERSAARAHRSHLGRSACVASNGTVLICVVVGVRGVIGAVVRGVIGAVVPP